MKKKIILPIIVGLLMVMTVVGVTYAFFNYTRTGGSNTIKVGRIYFNHTQDNIINLTNVFPTSSTSLNSTNSDTVTINITGDTTYSKGIEYKVTLEDINNTINGKEVPISFNVTANNLGTKSSNYYSERGSTTNVYNLVETGLVDNNKMILVGYIKPDAEGVNGSIDITAYIDSSNVAISDTVSRIDNGNLIYGETGGEWIAGREVLTTEEWNSFSSTPLSFKVKVEANEGIWVEEEKQYVLANLNSNSNWTSIRANITSIEFHKDGAAPTNSVTSFDATDITSAGPVTLYTVDDGLGNNTYKAIVVADDVIYAPEYSRYLFRGMKKLTTFNSSNFRVDNVTNMNGIFGVCSSLTDIGSIATWDTSKVIDMGYLFRQCSSLTDINALINWNTSNVTNMSSIFYKCTNLNNIAGLINWNVSNVINMFSMFEECRNLKDVSVLSNWNISNVTDIGNMFVNCQSLTNINGLINWNTSKVENMGNLFTYCSSLTNINGLVNWNTSNVTNMYGMFLDCAKLIDFSALSNWNTSNVTDMTGMFRCTVGTKNGDPVIDFLPLSNWNVSNVTSMATMFQNVNILSYQAFANWNVGKVQDFDNMFNATSASTVTTLAGLENWDVSSATDMFDMFADNVSLTDASAINNWNIKSSIDFTEMFYHTPVHPTFTKVSGTWDENGTFTPSG